MKYGTMTYIVSENNNVLMIKKEIRQNDPNSGYFTLPGGKLEDFEKGLKNLEGRAKSAIRETKDETGIIPIKPVLRGVIFFDNKDRKFPNWPNPDNFYVYIFYTNKYRGEPKQSDEGIPITVPLCKVKEIPSNPGDKKMYEWLDDGRNFIGVIKHKGDKIDPEGTWVDFFN
jgi:ADP-ribose pyrophosphatase YjhB (NUDIX family)